MKKVLGILMIIVGFFLSIPFFAMIPEIPFPHSTIPKEIWKFIGALIAAIFTLSIILLLIFGGIKIIRSNNKVDSYFSNNSNSFRSGSYFFFLFFSIS